MDCNWRCLHQADPGTSIKWAGIRSFTLAGVLPRAGLTGAPDRSFRDDWYHRIHVQSSKVSLLSLLLVSVGEVRFRLRFSRLGAIGDELLEVQRDFL